MPTILEEEVLFTSTSNPGNEPSTDEDDEQEEYAHDRWLRSRRRDLRGYPIDHGYVAVDFVGWFAWCCPCFGRGRRRNRFERFER
jgi:hypothetical protein